MWIEITVRFDFESVATEDLATEVEELNFNVLLFHLVKKYAIKSCKYLADNPLKSYLENIIIISVISTHTNFPKLCLPW